MQKRIAIIDGHPDFRDQRFVHALARAYRDGAEKAGHEVRGILVGALDFPLLRTSEDFGSRKAPPAIRQCQQVLEWADHWLILYPMWLGSMPAALKAFFEQAMRPGFAFAAGKKGRLPRKLLKGKSARIVVTMGMPALFYRWYYRAHSLRSLERNILAFCGISPVHADVVGSVDAMSAAQRKRWLAKLKALGRKGT
jgi:putative NADPH-quinone reductase